MHYKGKRKSHGTASDLRVWPLLIHKQRATKKITKKKKKREAAIGNSPFHILVYFAISTPTFWVLCFEISSCIHIHIQVHYTLCYHSTCMRVTDALLMLFTQLSSWYTLYSRPVYYKHWTMCEPGRGFTAANQARIPVTSNMNSKLPLHSF
jgi:hypothetical protein